MFRQLDKEDLNQTIDDFKKQINVTIHDNGYDTIGDAVLHGVESNFQGKKTRKPDINAGTRRASAIGKSRYEYFLTLLEDVVYERNYRGYYKEGHAKALEIYRSKAEFCNNDLVSLEEDVAKEIHRVKLNRKTRDRFEIGYYDGLHFIEKALKRSKLYMMTMIKEEMEKMY